ncbi:TerB family tellurite resistance protein [Clostridium estertheticum]|uniref:TerB family tellurite resistance protein n=1 Tax=Clostridium estertheticum TaxID=238834 RepID=UPI001CF14021|nr:TerB family tellurite resistance protein [Clostridium estertheticum]MCB2308722.1 TerB family tellurite resistance protein [Clostridium estertheticum]MCB2347451.1 TerB family tellurite resistance protein [Clostridium estertheticum]MCB2351724.1 TerB family tellurite resistance protein [Clostridium estertheticum]WAG46303.1 TerB family tellurite resistance protein [Clostridium estertheticum]
MGGIGMFIIVALLVSWVFNSIRNGLSNMLPSNSNSNSNKIRAKCPYCGELSLIDSEDSWKCACGKVFVYRNSTIYKMEDTCSDIAIHVTALLAKIAKADGFVTKEEVSVLEEIYNRFELNNNQQNEAGRIFSNEKSNISDYKKHIHKVKELAKEREILKVVVECMFMITMTDKNFNNEQEKMILEAVSAFGLSECEYKEIKDIYVEDLDEYYKILCCSNKSTDDEVKKAYRQLMMQYHPDKYVSKDLPQDILDSITEKYRKIQESYDIVNLKDKTKINDMKKSYQKEDSVEQNSNSENNKEEVAADKVNNK